MRKQITIFLTFSCMLMTPVFAQEEEWTEVIINDNGFPDPHNFIVLIDGKLPRSLFIEISWGEGTYKQILTYNYNLYYEPKTFYFSQNPSILDSLPDTTNIHVNIIFREALDYLEYKKQVYGFDITLQTFKIIKIITVKNFNKKKNIYYVHYLLQPPVGSSAIWEKRYGNYRKFRKRVYEGLYPSQYQIPQKYPYRIKRHIPNGKSHPHGEKSYPLYR